MDVVAAIPEENEAGKENWIAPALKKWGIPFVTFNKTGSPGRLLKNITAIIDDVRPDIVHSHLLDSNLYSSIACRRRSVTHICTEHGDVSLGLTAKSKCKYILLSLCSRYIICVSEAVKERAGRVIPFQGKLKTVYNGIHFFDTRPSRFREEYGIPLSAVVIGTVGNLYPVKGHKYLIRAFAEIHSRYPTTYLVIVGRGGEENNLRDLVAYLKIPPDQVVFTGFRDDVENVMNTFDLYVQSSLSEGHPVAVLEAMSLGIPVIATAVGGVPEVIGRDRYGTLAESESWESLYGCMREFFYYPEVLRVKALVARKHVRATFSIEKMARSYFDIYQQILSMGEAEPS